MTTSDRNVPIVLRGCRSEPVGSYLRGLGIWRAVVRLLDPDTRAHWTPDGLVLTTRSFDEETLLVGLLHHFAPLPVVSPWNGGSGFAGNGKSANAERQLEVVRGSTDPRLARMRAAVAEADRVVAKGRELGWGGTGEELWSKDRKADVIQLCRNSLPDDALPWVDSAVVLGQGAKGELAPTFSRLLGTGGNFGRQDLSATYLQQALALLTDPKLAKRSAAWLRAALTGEENVPYERGTVGQFDPGRAGGVQSSPLDGDGNGFVNPWSLLFTIEGTVMFASAAVRREGATTSSVAVPFLVRSSAVGFASTADAENVSAELWMPEWREPASFAEIEHLLGEGRVEWNGKPARNGLDFVRAIFSLGVDRGISHFTRHVIAERMGQNPLAVPVGRFAVPERAGRIGLLADIDAWLGSVLAASPPGGIATLIRQTDAAIFEMAQHSSSVNLRAVVTALGRLHEAVSRSSAARDRVRPLVVRSTAAWWEALTVDGSHPELRLAAALASATDLPSGQRARWGGGILRTLLTPVVPDSGGARLVWSGRPAPVPWAGGTIEALAQAHRRRAVAGAVADPHAGDTASLLPAVKGVLSGYRAGLHAPLSDVVAMATGRIDTGLLGDLLRGLLLFDWSRADAQTRAGEAAVVPPDLALLVPFFAVEPLRTGHGQDPRGRVVLRPGAGWLAQLRGQPAAVLADAQRRLAAAGIDAIRLAPSGRRPDPESLAAALLVRVSEKDRLTCVRAVSIPPSVSSPSQGVDS